MNQPLLPRTTPPTSQWFGRRPPSGLQVLAAFGARAILQGRGAMQDIDIPYDRRQTWTHDSRGLPREFEVWLRDEVTPWLRRRCGQRWINPGGSEVYTLSTGRMRAEASAQTSYGYLYIGAWLAPPETA